MKEYNVWVRGIIVSDPYISEEEANKIAKEYRDKGCDDVEVVEVT